MGDGSDFSGIARFMVSREGKGHLNTIRQSLLGQTVSSVAFENNTGNIKTIIQFDNGSRFYCIQPCHDIAVLRELFEAAIEGESVGSSVRPSGPG